MCDGEHEQPIPNPDCSDFLGIMSLQLKLKKRAVLPAQCVVEVQRIRKDDLSTVRTRLDHVRLVNTRDAVFLWGQNQENGERTVVRIPWSSVHYVASPLPQAFETESELISLEPNWIGELIR